MTVKARRKHDIIKARGIARYAHLNEPDKKFDQEYGVYSCDLVITAAGKQEIVNKIKPLYEQELKDVMDAHPGKKIEQKGLPIKDIEDGQFLLHSKLKGGHKNKVTGQEWIFSVALFDSTGKPLPEDVQVWGGSEVNLAFRPNFYYVPSIGFGVRFEIQAVQVIQLKNGGVGGVAAESFGFTEEEGYIANGGENLDQAFDAEETSEEEPLTANF